MKRSLFIMKRFIFKLKTQDLCFYLWIQKEWQNGASLTSCIYKGYSDILCTCKSNTAAFSQEIITAISILVRSLAAWLAEIIFGSGVVTLPEVLWQNEISPALSRYQGISLCQHTNILPPPVSLSLCLQNHWCTCHLSGFIQIYPHVLPHEAAAPFVFAPGWPESTWPAVATFEGGDVKEAKMKQGNKGDGEDCVSAGFGFKAADEAEIQASASKTTEGVGA